MASTTHKRRPAPQKRRTAPRTTSDPNRWRNVSTRRKPKQSNMQKAIGMLPTGKKASSTKSSRGGTAGKAAMLTAAAGLAFKNRDKIAGMLGKRKAADPKI